MLDVFRNVFSYSLNIEYNHYLINVNIFARYCILEKILEVNKDKILSLSIVAFYKSI